MHYFHAGSEDSEGARSERLSPFRIEKVLTLIRLITLIRKALDSTVPKVFSMTLRLSNGCYSIPHSSSVAELIIFDLW